ncbi:MAG: FMN-binding negative transcriptional regulator [Aquabacterium sp.]
MYSPPHFQESRPEVLAALIQRHPLGCVTTMGAEGLVADHIPLILEADASGGLKLIGHVARANPIWQYPAEQRFLVVFQGPSAYISPNWYATKQPDGKVVPTWNYAVVHAHATLQAIHEPQRVLHILTKQTDQHEAAQPHPWRVADAPAEFTDKLLAHIVGIELTVLSMQGKWKISQNQPAVNQASVVQGLLAAGAPEQVAMAEWLDRCRNSSAL